MTHARSRSNVALSTKLDIPAVRCNIQYDTTACFFSLYLFTFFGQSTCMIVNVFIEHRFIMMRTGRFADCSKLNCENNKETAPE